LCASAANEDDPEADRTADAVTGIPPFAAITIPFSSRPTATKAMPGRRKFATTKTNRKTYEAMSSPTDSPTACVQSRGTGTHWRISPAKATQAKRKWTSARFRSLPPNASPTATPAPRAARTRITASGYAARPNRSSTPFTGDAQALTVDLPACPR
jgi:hypothetical protein